jgi:hypothetical protein
MEAMISRLSYSLSFSFELNVTHEKQRAKRKGKETPSVARTGFWPARKKESKQIQNLMQHLAKWKQ